MVVTRRQSASPMPAAASRTNSSTGSSRSSKGKGIDKGSPLKDSGAGPSYVPPNGTPLKPPPVGPRDVDDMKFDDDSPPVPPKSSVPKTPTKSKSKLKAKKTKSKKHHSNKGISAFDIIARLFLVWLTVYTLSVCPEDVERRSPVCRALTEYRRIILEPYIYPPIRSALDHPAVAPHIQRVKPYYNYAVQVSTPWVRLGKREWRNRVVPQLQWLQLRAQPYVLRAERQYDMTVGPYVRQASRAALRARRQAEPYVLAAAVKSHQNWETAKPYLIPAWREAKRIPGIVAVYVGRPLGQARRQWVDPQVTKIWDAVVEQGKADTPVAQTASTKSSSFTYISSIPVSFTSSTSLATSTVEVDPQTSTIASVTPPPIPEPTDDAAASASSIIVETASVTESSTTASAPMDSVPDSKSEPNSFTTPPVPEPTASASSIIVESVSVTGSSTTASASIDDVADPKSEPNSFAAPPIPEQTDAAAASASSIIHESEGIPSSVSEDITTPPDVSTTSSSGTQASADASEVDDLDDFLSELDLDPEPPIDQEPMPEPSQVPEESEEERQERLRLKVIETAEKRADIEGRHAQWEIDIEKFGKAQRKAVRATLKRLREAASEEARAPGGPVRGPIEALVQEAEKSLKSLNAYARKLATEDKAESEKIKTWGKVVDKVDKKFGDRVDVSAESVKEWWDSQIEQENREIAHIAKEVTNLADRAQADLGMDYAWLPNVTYDDWQRYHKLVRTSQDFNELYVGMQNGSAPNPPANPVAEIMEAVQEEVDDMILGFEANLGRVKSAVIDTLSATATTDLPLEASKAPTAAVTASSSEPSPEVSILPIDPSAAKQMKRDVPPVILSRGAGEVESAVSKAEEAKTKAAHVEL